MQQHLVVVGAGRAGLFAIEGARRSGYDGPITLIGAEPEVPYDRPPLSKGFLDAAETEASAPIYRSRVALRDSLGVHVRTGTAASRIAPDERTVWLGDEPLRYSSLVIATGATPRTLPGAGRLDGILTLRTVSDARRLRAYLDAHPRTVVIGAGLIGSEVAAAARRRNLPTTLVEALPRPLSHLVDERCGRVCARLHERHGTRLLTNVQVTAVEGRGHVERVRLSDGHTLDADLVVIGIGVRPATSWLAGSDLRLDDGVVCDASLCTGIPGVYAAGDVMRWHNPQLGRLVRLENWTSAAEQGRLAARNALDPGLAETYSTVPYVWSDQYGSRLQIVGTADTSEVVPISEADDGYLALYRSGNRLTGAFGINQTRVVPRLRSMTQRGVAFREAVALCTA